MWLVCGLLGAGTLLPFNVLITENAYYAARFHSPPTLQAAADAFEPLLTASFNAPYVLAGLLYLSLRLEHHISIAYQVPPLPPKQRPPPTPNPSANRR